MYKLQCATMCSNTHQNILKPRLRQQTLQSHLLSCLGRAALPLKQAALPRLKMTIGAEGVFYLFLIPSNDNLAHFHDSTTRAAPLSPLQGSQAFLPWFSSKSLRDWASNLRLRVAPTDLQLLEHMVHIKAGGLHLLLLELAHSRLERRPWSLPTCVAAPGGF
jgi:hypothetical protein